MKTFKQFLSESIIMDGDKPMKFYHGTDKDFDTFRPKFTRGMQLGFGIHFTTDPEHAAHYATYQRKEKNEFKRGANIRPVYLNVNKALDLDKIYKTTDPEYEFAKELYRGTNSRLLVHYANEDGTKEEVGKFVIDLNVTSPQRAERLLRKYGYDAVWYTAKILSAAGYNTYRKHGEARAIIVLDPSQIISPFQPTK